MKAFWPSFRVRPPMLAQLLGRTGEHSGGPSSLATFVMKTKRKQMPPKDSSDNTALARQHALKIGKVRQRIHPWTATSASWDSRGRFPRRTGSHALEHPASVLVPPGVLY